MSRFAIDARAAAEEPAGRGRVVRELLRALAARDDDHGYELFARERWAEPLDERFRWRLVAAPDPLWHLRAARAANAGAEAFLSTNSYLTAWFLRVPTVVVVYDLVPFQPEVAARRSSGLIERATIGRGVRRAERLVCISEATRSDLVERHPEAATKAVVVPLAADERFARPHDDEELAETRRRYGLEQPFVLSAGTLEPRKNLARLIQAFAELSDTARGEAVLALVGPRGWDDDEILRLARGQGDRVRLLGHVPDDDLAALYASCTAFAYPSLYEGFGLPVLEALAAGAAVLTSDVSSLPEVGGDAVLYVDPRSVEAIRSGLEQLLTPTGAREGLRARARGQAGRFSWERTAAGFLAQLEAVTRS
jgi:glycosyltransferase involved in cell wall biosynthesis